MSVPGVMVPPLAITFTTSTRRSARSRTAARSASSPATSPPIIQQCPPTEVMGGPEATMCGPWSAPARSRRSTTAQRSSPRSRTVVTPEASCWASAVSITACSWSAESSGRRSRAPFSESPHRWTCALTRPGSNVPLGRSMSSTPSGTAAPAASTPAIRPSSTKTTAPSGRSSWPSKARDARIASIGDGVPHRGEGLVSRRSRPTTTGPRPARPGGPGRPRSPAGSGPGAAARTDPTTAPPRARGRPTR